MPTNFPKQGDDKAISLRNSNYPQFDYGFAARIKENYPDIWDKGGNIRGNEAFEYWGKARDGDKTDGVLDWIREREAWMARHEGDFRIAGVVAVMKWGGIVTRGEKYMKDLINKEVDKLKNNELQTLRLNTNGVKAEVKQWRGVDYLVAPVVAVREMVLNGELLPEEEIAMFPEAWNFRPITINHPQKDGKFVSANSIDVLDQYEVGFFNNVSVDGDKLKGEIWFNTARATEIGGDALVAQERLEKGELLEVSTGYFRELEEKSGVFNRKQYYGIARKLRPDHLALLPNEVGACSLKDGCGAMRANQLASEKREMIERKMMDYFGDKWRDSMWLRDFDEEEMLVIYMDRGKYYQANYSEENGVFKLSNTQEVEDKTVYEPVSNQESIVEKIVDAIKGIFKTNKGDEFMNRKDQLVSQLAANCDCHPFTEAQLKTMSEEVLETLATNLSKCAEKPADGVKANSEQGKHEQPQEPVKANEELAEALELVKAIKELGGVNALKDTISAVNASKEAERNVYVEQLKANGWNDDDMQGMSVNALKKACETIVRPAFYGARPLPQVAANADNDIPVAPSILGNKGGQQ